MDKITLVTYKNSIFGFLVLHVLKRENIKIGTIIVINKSTNDYLSDLLLQINRVGVLSSIFYSFIILFNNIRNRFNLRRSRIILDYSYYSESVVFAPSPNSNISLSALKDFRPDITILAHCGLVNSRFLFFAGLTINSHPGILPYYRGLDVIEWTVFEREFNKLGCTLHVVNEGIDSGNIIYSLRYRIRNNDDLTSIKIKIRNLSIFLILKFLTTQGSNIRHKKIHVPKKYPLYSKMPINKRLSINKKVNMFIRRGYKQG